MVARSSAEVEFRALAQGICEGIWIKRVLSELGMNDSSSIDDVTIKLQSVLLRILCIMIELNISKLTSTSSPRRLLVEPC